MGNCATGSNGHQYEQSQLQKYKSLVHQKQFQLLHLVYDDLAQRIKQRALSIDNFLLFFHKNGEWGDRLFKQFDADSSKYISEEEFIKGIVRIFKTSEDQKIELLFKFFSGENSKKSQGISFKHFLTMLYNYPKQDIKKILNDQDFINKELRHHLRAVDNNKFRGRRLVSINPSDAKNKQIFGMKFRVDDSDSGSASQRIQSKLGHQIIRKLSKQASENVNQTSFKIRVGQNDVEVKTASIHHLVKKMAKGIFREYKIDQKNGRLKYEYFKDWIRKHKNLYDDYYRSFHNQIWQLDPQTQIPVYIKKLVQMSSKARIQMKEQMKKVNISLINNVIIVCEQNEHQMPFMLICLQGLIAKPIFEQSNGYGFEISHRDGNYQSKKFYLLNKNLMQRWMQDHLKYFKGTSISQSYQIKQKIGTGKFSVVYKAKQKATNQYFALKVIQAFKLNQQSRNLIAYLFDKCRHESTIMQVFQHPLIVRLKQTIKTKNHIYIVTQLVNGKDLYEFVKDLKYLCQPQAAYIIQQLLIGVRYLHSLGLVHRDLKPENVMIQYNQQKKQIGKIKIIDFGFANHLSKLKTFSQECKILNNQELLAGTPNYIAPQILLKQQFNQKIDNFAIGSILYFALSGNTPFNSHDMAQILSKTVQGAYVLNDKRWKQVSQSAKDLVQKLLQSQSESRISLDDALNHCWFKKFHCVGGAAYSIKQVDIKGITP